MDPLSASSGAREDVVVAEPLRRPVHAILISQGDVPLSELGQNGAEALKGLRAEGL